MGVSDAEKIKFCTSCQAVRKLEGGIVRVSTKSRRWICKSCLDRKSESIYKSNPKNPYVYYERLK